MFVSVLEKLTLKKLRLGCKKNTWFRSIQCYTQNETTPPKKVVKKDDICLFEFWCSLARAVTHAVTYLSSDGAELSDWLFGQNKLFFFLTFLIYVYVCFVGNVAVSV